MDFPSYPGAVLYGSHSLATPDQNQIETSDCLEGIYPSPDHYNSFDPSLQLESAFFEPAPHPARRSTSNGEFVRNPDLVYGTADKRLETEQIPSRGSSSSSEERASSLVLSSRRKEQNRAAQRAFRERKERHVRELENKITCLEKSSTALQADNERLKQELAKSAIENEALRATSSVPCRSPSASSASSLLSQHKLEEQPMTAAQMRFAPIDFFPGFGTEGHSPMHRVMVCEVTGEKLLGSHATWDLIQSHELFKRGMISIADVSERLKKRVQCDGSGPAFREGDVHRAIEESAASGNDELI